MTVMKTMNEFGFGAWQSAWQGYFAQPTPGAAQYEKAAKSLAHCQLELWGLASRRAQAMLDMPAELAQCRTPDALARVQAAYLKTAFEQYAETSGRMVEAMSSVTGIMPQAAAVEAAPEAAGHAVEPLTAPPRERDYIALPSPVNGGKEPARRRSNSGKSEGAHHRVVA